MGRSLKLTLLVGSIVAVLFVLRMVIKNKMNIHYAMVWIIWGLGMVALVLFPSIGYKVRDLLKIEMLSNAIFFVNIFFLYCLTFYIYIIISKHNEEIIRLNYEISSLKKRLDDKEKKED